MADFSDNGKEMIEKILEFLKAGIIKPLIDTPSSMIKDINDKSKNILRKSRNGGQYEINKLMNLFDGEDFATFQIADEEVETYQKSLNKLGAHYSITGNINGAMSLVYPESQIGKVHAAIELSRSEFGQINELSDSASLELFKGRKINAVKISALELQMFRDSDPKLLPTYGVFDPDIHAEVHDYILVFDEANAEKAESVLFKNKEIIKDMDDKSIDNTLTGFVQKEYERNNLITMASPESSGMVMFDGYDGNLKIVNDGGNLTLYSGDEIIKQVSFDGDRVEWGSDSYDLLRSLRSPILVSIEDANELTFQELVEDRNEFIESGSFYKQAREEVEKVKERSISSRIHKVSFKDDTIKNMSKTVEMKVNSKEKGR